MQLKQFRNYLISKKYTDKTIKEDCLNTHRFLMWLNLENEHEISQLTTVKLVEYINSMQSTGIAASTINIRLRSIRKYFDHLKIENKVSKNIANVTVKGTVKKVVIDPLDYSDLEQLYKDYANYKKQQVESLKNQNLVKASETCERTALKRKVMLGFIVFQGLHTGELKRLEVNHIKTDDVTVYVVGSKKSKARHLKLQPLQMQALFIYLSNLEEQTGLLKGNLNNQVNDLFEELKGINEKIQNALHIRSSVILHWLTLHGKRQVQYMIGHKWISSTEHYENQNIEALTSVLDQFHPFLD